MGVGGGERGCAEWWRQGLSSVRSGATADYAYFYVWLLTGRVTYKSVFDDDSLRLTDEMFCSTYHDEHSYKLLGLCYVCDSYHFRD